MLGRHYPGDVLPSSGDTGKEQSSHMLHGVVKEADNMDEGDVPFCWCGKPGMSLLMMVLMILMTSLSLLEPLVYCWSLCFLLIIPASSSLFLSLSHCFDLLVYYRHL